jgi:bifunctional non-homologous end joining protein LigD
MKTRSDASSRLPDFWSPCKQKLVDSMRPGDWIYKIKFDGYRALALRGGGETRVISRNKKDFGKKFPAIADSIAELDVQHAIIDGEIVALDEKGRSSFQLLQGFNMGQERPPVVENTSTGSFVPFTNNRECSIKTPNSGNEVP